jgi:hypothetical protein
MSLFIVILIITCVQNLLGGLQMVHRRGVVSMFMHGWIAYKKAYVGHVSWQALTLPSANIEYKDRDVPQRHPYRWLCAQRFASCVFL